MVTPCPCCSAPLTSHSHCVLFALITSQSRDKKKSTEMALSPAHFKIFATEPEAPHRPGDYKESCNEYTIITEYST